MKSHQLFICNMRVNVPLKTKFLISQCEDVGGCPVEGPGVCCAVQVQQERRLAQMLVPHKARALCSPVVSQHPPVPF